MYKSWPKMVTRRELSVSFSLKPNLSRLAILRCVPEHFGDEIAAEICALSHASNLPFANLPEASFKAVCCLKEVLLF